MGLSTLIAPDGGTCRAENAPGGWGVRVPLLDWLAYVEEDQQEEGQAAPQQGQPRQTPQHGPLTKRLDRARVTASQNLMKPPVGAGGFVLYQGVLGGPAQRD